MSAKKLLNKALTLTRLLSAAVMRYLFVKSATTGTMTVGIAFTRKRLSNTARGKALAFPKGMQKAFFQESFKKLLTVINRPSKRLVSVFEKRHAFKPKKLRPFGDPEVKTVPSLYSAEPIAQKTKLNEDATGFDSFGFHYAASPLQTGLVCLPKSGQKKSSRASLQIRHSQPIL
jgi:hypothetical protein